MTVELVSLPIILSK